MLCASLRGTCENLCWPLGFRVVFTIACRAVRCGCSAHHPQCKRQSPITRNWSEKQQTVTACGTNPWHFIRQGFDLLKELTLCSTWQTSPCCSKSLVPPSVAAVLLGHWEHDAEGAQERGSRVHEPHSIISWEGWILLLVPCGKGGEALLSFPGGTAAAACSPVTGAATWCPLRPPVPAELRLQRVNYCQLSPQQPHFSELTQSAISSQSKFLLILIKEHGFLFRAISTRPDTGCSLQSEISSSAGTCSGRTMPFKAPS